MTRSLPRADLGRPGLCDRRKRHGRGNRCAKYPRYPEPTPDRTEPNRTEPNRTDRTDRTNRAVGG